MFVPIRRSFYVFISILTFSSFAVLILLSTYEVHDRFDRQLRCFLLHDELDKEAHHVLWHTEHTSSHYILHAPN